MTTLGQSIGTVVDNFSVTNTAGVSVQIRALIDYSSVSDTDIVNWLNGNRRISCQRVLRSMKAEEIKALDGSVFNANSIGQKVKSDAEVKAEYMARFGVSSPEDKARMIAEMQAEYDKLNETVEDEEEDVK